MSVGWNLNDSTIFLLSYIYIFPFFSKMIALHQNVANCQNTLTMLTLRWRILFQDVWMGPDAGTTQDNFILPALHIAGLLIYQDWLDKMKLICECTTPIILPSGKNITVNMVFTISVEHTNLDTRPIQSRLGRRVCLFITPNVNMARYRTKK